MNTVVDEDIFSAVPVIGISRHRLLTDGNGITTLVAFHGCPLSCAYCINPNCNNNDGIIRWITPRSLYNEMKRDDFYFRSTGGGICFGGGEPLLQYDFIKKFKTICGNKWNITIETSLNAPLRYLQELYPFIDEYVVDIKDMSESIYSRYTKNDNSNVIRNLQYLANKSIFDHVLIRVPSIPGFNEEKDLDSSIEKLSLLGFHRFDRFKYIVNDLNKVYDRLAHKENDQIPIGKAICEVLKKVRLTIAEANDIMYIPAICNHKGDCPGTCPKCEEELREISRILWTREANGLSINI